MTPSSDKVWPTKRMRFVTNRTPSTEQRLLVSQASLVTFLPMEAIGEQGKLDLSNVREIELVNSGYTQFFEGDVVVAKITPCFENGKGALVRGTLGGVGFGTTELHVLNPTHEIDGRFLYFVTASSIFRGRGEAVMTGAAGQKRVPEDFVRDFQVPVPSLDQQYAVVSYLNREILHIDTLIAAKERILGLLDKKRQALVTQAILRGLNLRVPLRASGIPWLGDIPAHWQTERAKHLFLERDQRSVTGEEELLSVSHLTGVTPRSEKDVNMFEAETNEGYKICLSGDLVINTLWAWMGAMGVSWVNGIVSPAYNVYKPASSLIPGYIDALVRLPIFAQEVTRYSKGVWSSRLRLYPEGFFEVFFPVPPVQEQHAIVAHIAQETARIDNLRDAIMRTVALLKERRAALISAAVTGQINVENAA